MVTSTDQRMSVKNAGQWLFLISLTIMGLLWTFSRPEGDAELSISKNSLIQTEPKHFFKKSAKASKQGERIAAGSNRVHSNIVETNVNRSLMNMTEKDSTQCANYEKEIKFAPKHSMPLVALASFPRSGNTWTRYMLQIATQIYTTSVYWKNEMHEASSTALKGSQIDYRDGRGIVVKSHRYEENHVRSFEGAILLIRNPYESSVSDFFRVHTFVLQKTDREVRQLVESRAEIWIQSTEKSFINWHDLNLSWIKNSKRLLIVYYKDLIEHPERELTRMTMFLGQPVKPHLIRCATQAYPWRDRKHLSSAPYFPSRLAKYIQKVNKTLIERNARPLPSYWV